ncbi:hypothetical protein HID58_005729 [Brassica napus]|uniref:Uncharacterized protein n=1 Tax=Brassica napus TaxID=3708 RepID=A0ABQ8EA16_BRANA|nr:hypothetical protein HID58_005729 [Brassica napus]
MTPSSSVTRARSISPKEKRASRGQRNRNQRSRNRRTRRHGQNDAEAGNDLTSQFTTLQQELSTEEQNAVVFEIPALSSSSCSSSSSCASKDEEYESDKEKVMKHLLEASDDELGIPNTKFGESNYEVVKNESNQDYINGFSLLDGFGDGLWELEDEAANYYTLLQSELFT